MRIQAISMGAEQALQVGVVETHRTLSGEQGIETFTYNFQHSNQKQGIHPSQDIHFQNRTEYMFQDIEICQAQHFQEQIRRGFVSRQGVVVAAGRSGRIAIFHRDWTKRVQHLDEYLEKLSFRFRKCWDIQQEEGEGNKTVLVLGLDKSICVVEVELVQNEEDAGGEIVPQIRNAQFLRVVEQQEVSNKRYSLTILGLRNNLLLLTLYLHKTSIKIIAFQIEHQPLTVTKAVNATLTCEQEQPHFSWLQKLLYLGFQVRRFDHYLIIYDELVFENVPNKFLIVDLGKCTDLQYHIQAPCQLVQSQSAKILKDIYVVPSNKPIEECSLLLFYQHQQCLEIIQVNMSNPSVPLKHMRHPAVILHKILSCSMNPQAVELRGEDYCLETLNFLIQGKTELNGQDKLIILPAPFAFKPNKIINQTSLPIQLLHITNNYAICSSHLYKINLIPKHTIYRHFLSQWNPSQPLFHMIQQLLN